MINLPLRTKHETIIVIIIIIIIIVVVVIIIIIIIIIIIYYLFLNFIVAQVCTESGKKQSTFQPLSTWTSNSQKHVIACHQKLKIKFKNPSQGKPLPTLSDGILSSLERICQQISFSLRSFDVLVLFCSGFLGFETITF